MKKYAYFLMAIAMCSATVAMAAPGGASTARHSTVAAKGGMVGAAAARKASLASPSTVASTDAAVSSKKFDSAEPNGVAVEQKDMREKERLACMSNNIGVGNTFVWASRTSNLGNYSSMIEDTENPDNNVCFVRVELKSNDSRINVSDFGAQYFEMGQRITCGSWANEEKLQNRILDAKKSARTWATVGGAVGGAAIGVGSMELFGNKLIGGAVQGQAALEGTELLRSQLLVLKKNNQSEYNKIISELKTIKAECEKSATKDDATKEMCNKYDYQVLISTESAK